MHKCFIIVLDDLAYSVDLASSDCYVYVQNLYLSKEISEDVTLKQFKTKNGHTYSKVRSFGACTSV